VRWSGLGISSAAARQQVLSDSAAPPGSPTTFSSLSPQAVSRIMEMRAGGMPRRSKGRARPAGHPPQHGSALKEHCPPEKIAEKEDPGVADDGDDEIGDG
jgi:hypothetical protein